MLHKGSVITSQVIGVAGYCFHAYAFFDGVLTTEHCGHNHSRADLAERCLPKVIVRWEAIRDKMVTVELLPHRLGCSEDLYEVRWHDLYKDEMRVRWTRFAAPHIPSHRD